MTNTTSEYTHTDRYLKRYDKLKNAKTLGKNIVLRNPLNEISHKVTSFTPPTFDGLVNYRIEGKKTVYTADIFALHIS